VPGLCTATAAELALRGPDAGPAGSHVGSGTAEGRFLGFPSELQLDVFNNTNQQIILARTPGLATTARGTLHPDGSVDFSSPTCYPSPPLSPPGCPVDNALQVASDITGPPLTTADGRSYMTTPATCPKTGYWETPMRFWWADGMVDYFVTRQPCSKKSRVRS